MNAILSRVLVFAGDYERAGAAVEAALVVAEAHELPDVLAEALVNKAILYDFTNRPQEAALCTPERSRSAERHELGDPLPARSATSGTLA